MRYLLPLLLLPGLAFAQSPVTIVPAPPPFFIGTTGAAASLTGQTTEGNIASIRIPANSLGKNGSIVLDCQWTYPNSANLKTMVVRWTTASGSIAGGVIGANTTATTTVSTTTHHIIQASNATNAETSFQPVATTPFGSSAQALTSIAVDTTADTFLNINGILALGSETLTVQHCIAIVTKAP